MKTVPSRNRPAPTKDELLSQVKLLLDRPDDDVQAALVKEMLSGILRLLDTQLDLLDLKIVNRALKELRHAFRVFRGYRDRAKISVFGSARTSPDDANYQMAFTFAVVAASAFPTDFSQASACLRTSAPSGARSEPNEASLAVSARATPLNSRAAMVGASRNERTAVSYSSTSSGMCQNHMGDIWARRRSGWKA